MFLGIIENDQISSLQGDLKCALYFAASQKNTEVESISHIPVTNYPGMFRSHGHASLSALHVNLRNSIGNASGTFERVIQRTF